MPMVSLKLKPGVNTELTPSLLEAGYSVSNLIRYRNGLAEKLGGWIKYFNFAVGGIPKAINAWQDLNAVDYLGVGSTTTLGAVANNTLTVLTPQALTSDFNPNVATTATSAIVTITDPNINTVTAYDSVEFQTPVAVGGIILSGLYPISLVLSSTSYQITAASPAVTTRANATITGATKANPCQVTTSGAHGFANGDLIYIYGVVGMTQLNGKSYAVTVTGGTTFTLGVDSTAYTTYTSGGTASPSAVPMFTTTSGSAVVSVTIQAHGLAVGSRISFPLATTVGGIVISGSYSVVAISGANIFTISANQLASSGASAFMNTGKIEVIYRIAIGPTSAYTGYSIGGYSTGGYSTGQSNPSQTGTPITATDWTLDNWGDTLLACPNGGAIYFWEPNTGFQNAQAIGTGPAYNAGMFVSMQTQMVIAYGSTVSNDIGIGQNPLLVKWCDQGDYTSWAISTTSQAGSRVLPTGSKIVGGMSVPGLEMLWTDLDLWSMNYLGSLAAGVWGFQKIGSNCGLIGRHAAARQGSNIYWMSASNFFATGSAQVGVVPCPIWDTVFQDLNTPYQDQCWAWSNTPANEIWFFYPRLSTSATTPDAYVKLNTRENVWDYGPMDRTCGIDQSVLGMPIAAASTGIVYEHEVSPDADGQPLNAYFESGYFALSDGQDIAFMNWTLPDLIWKLFDSSNQSASIQITYYSKYYPGDTPEVHGPYTVSQSTKYINPRIRGRLVSIRVESNDIGSFWRLGNIRSVVAPDGRL